jgi:hypothetical protein
MDRSCRGRQRLVGEVESDQKRSQQAFGGGDREMQPVVEAARKAVASE